VKNYAKFSVHDFAMDEYFQQWVFHPDENSDAFWCHWRTRHPEKAAELDEARDILNNFNLRHFALPAENVAQLWGQIKKTNGAALPARLGKNVWWVSAAAGVILAGFGIFFLEDEKDVFEYKTGYGETRVVLLPDSSTVILNANSHLSYRNNWDDQPARTVEVDGEAFFSVVHKADDQPFKVTTADGVTVEVLGTTFNIYHRSVDTKVVLNSGQISLSIPVAKKEKKILMKPGELIECGRDVYKKRIVDPRIYAAWTEKKIILDQTSLREMVRMAKDNYGIVIQVESEKMLDQTVSGSMPISDAAGFVNQVASVFHLEIAKGHDDFLLKEETKQ
jgi:transmembrane sensor